MLKFYYGTQLEKLADQLLEELRSQDLKNLLSPEIFVVQNHGIGQWLSLYMADKEGIAANLKFEFPSERVWSLIRQIDPEIPETLPSERESMTWSLMQLLGDDKVLADFEPLRHYVMDEDTGQRAVRTWKLSTKIADVFDQYLVYRPQMILNWENPDYTATKEAEQWQEKLWNRLIEHWKEYFDKEYLHRATLQMKLLRHLNDGTFDKDLLPERISVFGVSTLPPVFTEILVELSEYIDLHFYHLSVNPGVKDSGLFKNPLLQSMGREGAKFMSVFADHTRVEFLPVKTDGSSSTHSVFKKVQEDIRADSFPSEGSLNHPKSSPSIQVHSCHSPMREVEVLYDQLLALLDENPDLNPENILVMIPDIETYASMIEAVFEMPDAGQPAIPYHIADRGVKGDGPAVQCFLKILELCDSRFKVTDVLDLLESAPVREAFDFSEDDLNRLESWIRDNRIRWGVDGPFKREMKLPESESFTWKSGLSRIILGYAMKREDDKLYEGVFPYEEIETTSDAERAGKLSTFLNHLFKIGNITINYSTVDEWVDNLKFIIDAFLPDNREYFREVSRIREGLQHLKNSAILGGYEGPVPFHIIRSMLEEQFAERPSGGGSIGRGVTFSSLKPMRSIPFKVVGMIGMNDGAFPRSKIPIEFDLMNVDPRKGDPIRLEEDRNLFLENILSARSHLYFSYVGQSNREDSEFPPSVVLREFLDYLQEYYGLETQDILTKHRLQSFSPAYFMDNSLFSYSQTQRNVANGLHENDSMVFSFMRESLSPPGEEWKKLSVNSLISFFQQPAKYLFQNRLGIYLREDEVLTEDREPFGLNGLNGYWVGQELLERYFEDKPLDSYKQILKSRDMLPEGWSGEQAYHRKMREVRKFGSEIKAELDREQLEDCRLDIDIGEYRVVGKLSGIFKKSLITYRFGGMRAKDLIDLWIRHLLFQLVKPQGHPGYSSLFTRDKRNPCARFQLSPLNSREILEQLLATYWEGLQRGIYFFPETSYAFGEEVISKGKQPGSALNRAYRKWKRDYGSYNGEGADPYNKLMLGMDNPLETEQFQARARKFWSPFFEVLNKEEPV